MTASAHPRVKPETHQNVAERAAVERVLNGYLREAGRTPMGWPEAGSSPLPVEVVGGHSDLLWLPLVTRNSLVLGTLRRHSQVGLHRFGRAFWVRPLDRPNDGWRTASPVQIIELILEELAADSGTDSEGRLARLQLQVLNSIEKTTRYLHAPIKQGHGEQSVLFGHPFHPTPKSTEGFMPEDLVRYAPELGATFQLEYLEFVPELLVEESLSGQTLNVLGVTPTEGWGLLPCHPWQAQYLRTQPWMQALVAEGKVRFLGPQGLEVAPTSSVRTVRCDNFYLKLPLNVRITNYFRLNCQEHLERSLDVCRAIVAGPSPTAALTSTVLLENGWRTLRLPDQQAEQCGVLFRRAPTGPEPVVLAALLETGPDGEARPMTELLTRANNGVAPNLGLTVRWLRAYLEVALPAVMGWWLERGVSLEAHVQNSLVTLCKGWPTRLYLRDLEGGSLWPDHPASTWKKVGIDPKSPAIYTESRAWQRLLYYFYVNHLGHLVATLALACNHSEEPLWAEVNRSIRALPQIGPDELFRKYQDKLLNSAHLPAKANLTSRFQERSENPLYVAIPNPFANAVHAPRNAHAGR
jgi:siderophore synthetase component